MRICLLFISFLLLLSGCPSSNELPQQKPDTRNYNFIILLDLSDRIKKEHQLTRDKEVISLIIDKFENLVQQGQFSNSKDCLQIIIAPQQGVSLDAEVLKKLSINMTISELVKDENGKELNVNTKDGFDLKKQEVIKNIENLYGLSSKTPGADIYGFFKNSLANTYLKDSHKYFNKLFIITDGYLAFDNSTRRPKGTYISYSNLAKLRNNKDWVNIFEKEKMRLDSFKDGEERPNYQNLQVMMLEMDPENPHEYINEFDILKKIWKTWFEDLDIQDPEILQKEQETKATETRINDFMNKKPLKEKLTEETKVNIKFRGENYSLHLLENSEIVKRKKGEYFFVDIRQKDSPDEITQTNYFNTKMLMLFQGITTNSQISDSKKKVILFEIGKFEIPFQQVEKGITEFTKMVTSELEEKNIDYEIYIKGKADILSYNGIQNRYGNNEKICYLEFDENSKRYNNEQRCDDFKQEITNDDLPNLRAWALREKFLNIYSGGFKFKEPKVLQGSVENVVSAFERNGNIILYISNEKR